MRIKSPGTLSLPEDNSNCGVTNFTQIIDVAYNIDWL
jgi:hypothetical protein